MTRSERLYELTALKQGSSGILSSRHDFNEWHGRVSGLLAFDPIARHKFDHLCDYIIQEHDFYSGMIDAEVNQASNKMLAIVARAVSDLEINRTDSTPIASVLGVISAHAPVSEPIAPQDPDRPSTPDSKPKDLTPEEGLLYFWHHCHYTVKWRILYVSVPILAFVFLLGWKASKYGFFQEVGSSIHKVLYGDATTDEEDHKTKDIPKQP